MATKRGKANLPVSYAEQLAAEAAEISKRISAPTGDRIRYNGNVGFYTPDGGEGDVIEAVIVDFLSSNLYYDGPYDRDNPQPPACFAIGPEPSTLVPSKNSPDRQADTCSACPNNQFGSAANGKGKACKNTRLLALMPASALDSPEEEAPIWILSVPPTSLKAYDAYVASLKAKHGTIPLGVITEISLDPNSQFAAPRFKAIRLLEEDELGVFVPRRDEARERLSQEPDTTGYTPPKATRRAAGARRR